jgi:excisionase family DNA binding protein
MEPDEIMTVEQVAKYLKLKPQTVYKWAQEGQIPGTKLGKEWRFRRRILDEWIDTSIQLSRAGFDLMFQETLLAVRHQGISEEDLEKLLKEAESGR